MLTELKLPFSLRQQRRLAKALGGALSKVEDTASLRPARRRLCMKKKKKKMLEEPMKSEKHFNVRTIEKHEWTRYWISILKKTHAS